VSPMAISLTSVATLRVTPVGRIPRAWSLTGPRRLLTVLCSNMSLVGPKALSFYKVHLTNPWNHNGLCVRPRPIGLWQASDHRLTLFDDVARVDQFLHRERQFLHRERSLAMDRFILLHTVSTVLFCKGFDA
jgi:lipopolysaccharide/colanic/teichoic acid biosynthesis glycosyltransferase